MVRNSEEEVSEEILLLTKEEVFKNKNRNTKRWEHITAPKT